MAIIVVVLALVGIVLCGVYRRSSRRTKLLQGGAAPGFAQTPAGRRATSLRNPTMKMEANALFTERPGANRLAEAAATPAPDSMAPTLDSSRAGEPTTHTSEPVTATPPASTGATDYLVPQADYLVPVPVGDTAEDASDAHVYADPDSDAAATARTETPRYSVFKDSAPQAPAPIPATANLAFYEYSGVDTPDGQTYATPLDGDDSIYSSPA